jgi:hypothetical protein
VLADVMEEIPQAKPFPDIKTEQEVRQYYQWGNSSRQMFVHKILHKNVYLKWYNKWNCKWFGLRWW